MLAAHQPSRQSGLTPRTAPQVMRKSHGRREAIRTLLGVGLLWLASAADTQAQFVTVGAGVLLSTRSPDPVAEVHAETPPLVRTRAYGTLSWTDESLRPTLITAAERQLVAVRPVMVGLGAGLLWLDANDYRPYPILVSSAVLQLPIPRTSIVAIASTQPLQDFEWSLVLKLGFTVWFRR